MLRVYYYSVVMIPLPLQDAHAELVAAHKRKEDEVKRKEELVRYTHTLHPLTPPYTHPRTHTPHTHAPIHTPSQEKTREMTLKRRRNRLKLEANGGGSVSKRTSAPEYADNELDDLISVLRTGDYLSHRKSRSSSISSHRKQLEVNRDRPPSIIDGSFTEEHS